MLQHGLVQAAAQAGLEVAVQPGQLEHRVAVVPLRVEVAFEPDAGFGEGAGLVGCQHVHRAQVLDGRQPLHDDLLLGQAHRAPRQRHRHDHRQQLGRQAHGQGHGEHQRLQQGPLLQHRGQQHEEHQRHGHARQQQAEAPRAAFEGGGGRVLAQRVRQAAQHGGVPGGADQHPRGARHHRTAQQQHAVGAEGRLAGLGRLHGAAGHRKGFARQGRFVDVQVARFQQASVGWHQASCGQLHLVSTHQLAHRHRAGHAPAPHGGHQRHPALQRLHGAAGPVLLQELQRHAEQHDHRHQHEAGAVAQQRGHHRRRQQHGHQGMPQPRQEAQHHRPVVPTAHLVGAVLAQPLLRRCRVQARGPRAPGDDQGRGGLLPPAQHRARFGHQPAFISPNRLGQALSTPMRWLFAAARAAAPAA